MKNYRIFVVNPGSTSTKLALYENKEKKFECDVFHDSSVLKTFPAFNDQIDYRMKVIQEFLKKNNIDLHGIDAVAARGGGFYPVEGGTYEISDQMIQDAHDCVCGLYHASMLGVQMAKKVQELYGGIKGVYRHSATHFLNLKAACRKYAESIGRKYQDLNLIACHIDGGITITAHDHGRMIDANDGGGGEGPYTPTRMGGMAVTDVLRFVYDMPKEQLRSLCSQTGGFSSWFGTSNSDTIHAMVENHDPEAVLVWNGIIYRIAKCIGEMSMVLHGKVDGIILTGGLMRFDDVRNQLEDYCGWVAPIRVYPGEFEMEALALGVLRVLTKEETAKQYTGKPVWDGFDFDHK